MLQLHCDTSRNVLIITISIILSCTRQPVIVLFQIYSWILTFVTRTDSETKIVDSPDWSCEESWNEKYAQGLWCTSVMMSNGCSHPVILHTTTYRSGLKPHMHPRSQGCSLQVPALGLLVCHVDAKFFWISLQHLQKWYKSNKIKSLLLSILLGCAFKWENYFS